MQIKNNTTTLGKQQITIKNVFLSRFNIINKFFPNECFKLRTTHKITNYWHDFAVFDPTFNRFL